MTVDKDIKDIWPKKNNEGKVNHVSMLLKPTHDCNFNCQYCYDAKFRREFGKTKMTIDTFHKIIKATAAYAENLNLIWHGGEPLMMGTQWYIDAQKIIDLYPELKVTQSLQSNASLLSAEWEQIFRTFNIAVGMSFDGPYQSVRAKNFKTMEDIILKYKKAGGRGGFICVINKENFMNMIEIYEYFKNTLNSNMSFNHIFETSESLENNILIDNVDLEIAKTMEFYEYWLNDRDSVDERTSIENTNMVFGLGADICTHNDCRRTWIGINPLGDIYPCDRNVPERYRWGKIDDYENIGDAYKSEGSIRYYNDNAIRLKQCGKCDYGPYCLGGCPSNILEKSDDLTKNDPLYCKTLQTSFRLIYEIWRKLDIRKDYINNKLCELVFGKSIFTVIEIAEILKEYDIDITKLDYKTGNYNLMKNKEYKIFRLFNPIRRHNLLITHVDTLHASDKNGIGRIKWEDINEEVWDHRNKIMRQVVEDNLDKIKEIIGERNE